MTDAGALRTAKAAAVLAVDDNGRRVLAYRQGASNGKARYPYGENPVLGRFLVASGLDEHFFVDRGGSDLPQPWVTLVRRSSRSVQTLNAGRWLVTTDGAFTSILNADDFYDAYTVEADLTDAWSA